MTVEPESKVPAWAWEPIKRVDDYIKLDRDLVGLSMGSIAAVGAVAALLRVARRIGVQDDEVRRVSEAVEGAERVAPLAAAEVEDQFRRLLGHSLSGVWGAVEAMADDLVVAFLVNDPRHLTRPEFAKVKVTLAEFQLLDSDEERMETLMLEIAPRLPRVGIGRFESRLDLVFLGGPYNGEMADAIYELQQLRNGFVHRGGIVDRRLMKACPHLGLTLGEPIPLTTEQWERYTNALILYVGVVGNRIIKRFESA